MQSILIIAPNWIGDAVMTQPLLAQLQKQYPNSSIDVLATTWVAPIYRACSEVRDVIEAKLEHKKLQWNLRQQLAKRIQEKNYQACFVLPNSMKSALIPWLANIPFRIGYRGELRYGLINLALENPGKIHRPPMVDHYLALSQLLSDESLASLNSPSPQLNVSPDSKESVLKKLNHSSINPDSIFILCPGAEYGPTKRWPAEKFAQLAQAIVKADTNRQIILLGSHGDHAIAQEIKQQANNS